MVIPLLANQDLVPMLLNIRQIRKRPNVGINGLHMYVDSRIIVKRLEISCNESCIVDMQLPLM